MAKIKSIFGFLSLIAVLLMLNQLSSCHTTRQFSHNPEDFYDNYQPERRKMINSLRRMNDNMFVFQLNYFGTHDTMTYLQPYLFVQTQTLNIREQLEWGVRFVDIRVKIRDGRFQLFHGPINLGYDASLAFDGITKFLTDYPREYVIVGIQLEEGPPRHLMQCEILQEYIDKYSKHIFKSNSARDYNNLRVRDLRGKILFVGQDYFNYCKETFNMHNCKRQMRWDLSHNWELHDEKWLVVKGFAQEFNSVREYPKVCGINFLGASSSRLAVVPDFVVSGHGPTWRTYSNRLSTGLVSPWFDNYPDFPRTECALGLCTISFEGTNVLHWEHFGNGVSRKDASYVLITDFFGPDLPFGIFQSNIKKMQDYVGDKCTYEEIMGDCCNDKLYAAASHTTAMHCVPSCDLNDNDECIDVLIGKRIVTTNNEFQYDDLLPTYCEQTFKRLCQQQALHCLDKACNNIKLNSWIFTNISANVDCKNLLLSSTFIGHEDELVPIALPSFTVPKNLTKAIDNIILDNDNIISRYKSYPNYNYNLIIQFFIEYYENNTKLVHMQTDTCKNAITNVVSRINNDDLSLTLVTLDVENSTCIVHISNAYDYNCMVINRDSIVPATFGDYKLAPNGVLLPTNEYKGVVDDCKIKSVLYAESDYDCMTVPTQNQCLKSKKCTGVCDGNNDTLPNQCDCHYYVKCQANNDVPTKKWEVSIIPCPFSSDTSTSRLYFNSRKKICDVWSTDIVGNCDK